MTQFDLASIRQMIDHVVAMNNQAAQVRMGSSNWTKLLDELVSASKLLVPIANALRGEEKTNDTHWRLLEDEQPQDENAQICVLYISDAAAVVTTWADEVAEQRLQDIAAWLPIPHPIELRRIQSARTGENDRTPRSRGDDAK